MYGFSSLATHCRSSFVFDSNISKPARAASGQRQYRSCSELPLRLYEPPLLMDARRMRYYGPESLPGRGFIGAGPWFIAPPTFMAMSTTVFVRITAKKARRRTPRQGEPVRSVPLLTFTTTNTIDGITMPARWIQALDHSERKREIPFVGLVRAGAAWAEAPHRCLAAAKTLAKTMLVA